MPPIPSDVFSLSETAARTSTPNSFNRSTIALSLIRMRTRNVCAQQHCELIENAAHAARADRQNGIAWPRFTQHELDARLHGARKHHILVPGRADCFGKLFAGDVLDWMLARRVDFRNHENVRIVERAAKIVPEKLRA